MNAFTTTATAIPDREAESQLAELRARDPRPVNQPWLAHGAITHVGSDVYFYGNAQNPNDPCGQDLLMMTLGNMRPGPACAADGTMSYLLLPNDGSD